MTWILFCGDLKVVSGIPESSVNDLQRRIDGLLDAGGGWLDVSIPSEEGVTFTRFRVDNGIPILFYPDTDNRALVQGLD